MPRRIQFQWRQYVATLTVLLATSMAALPCQPAFAMTTGGEGNEPLRDPGGQRGPQRSSTTRLVWRGGKARPSAAGNGTPNAAGTRKRSTPCWPISPGST